MLDTKIRQQVDRLPLEERMALIEYAVRSVQSELAGKPVRKKRSSLPRLVGALKVKGKRAPDDDEIKKCTLIISSRSINNACLDRYQRANGCAIRAGAVSGTCQSNLASR